MKIAELRAFALTMAKAGRAEMIEKAGSFQPRAVLVDRRNEVHLVYFETMLHGARMARVLAGFAAALGGADVVAVQSDARLKHMTTEENAARLPSDNDIAGDPANPEALLTMVRSREHLVLVPCMYERTSVDGKDVITFCEPEPRIEDGLAGLELYMLPNIWERVH